MSTGYVSPEQEEEFCRYLTETYRLDQAISDPHGGPTSFALSSRPHTPEERQLAAMVVRLHSRVKLLEEMTRKLVRQDQMRQRPWWARNAKPGTLRYAIYEWYWPRRWAREMAATTAKQLGWK